MKLKEVNQMFAQIEHECDVNLITIDGLKAWPLIRSIIWSEFTKSQKKEKSKFSNGFSFLQGATYLLDVFNKLIKRQKINSNNNRINRAADTWFIGHARHRVKIDGLQNSFDRIMDPLVHLSREKSVSQSFTLGISKLQKFYFQSERIQTKRNVQKVNLLGLEQSGLFKYFNRQNIATSKMETLIQIGAEQYSRSYVTGRELLSLAPNVKQIFISVWYSVNAMGLIAAAHGNGIKVIEVQHAGEMHGMYTRWDCIPENGYELLPDVFWCWGEVSSVRVKNGIGHPSQCNSVVGGYPWHEFRTLLIAESKNSSRLGLQKKEHEIVILFSLQSLSFDIQQRVPEFVLNFLKMSNPGVSINFRRHPNDPKDKSELDRLRKSDSKTHFQISDSSDDLISAIQRANFHITAFSSVAFECLVLGVPTLLFGEQSMDLYEREIMEGVFSWTEGKVEDIFEFLKKANELKLTSESLIETSLQIAQGALSKIIA